MLLDTSGLYAFFDAGTVQHEDAVRLMAAARRRLTHSYVLAEFMALSRSYHHPSGVILPFLAALQRNPLVKVVYGDRQIHDRAMDLLQNRFDKEWSLCDAVSFVIMEHRGIQDALTTDHHLDQAGFVRLLQP